VSSGVGTEEERIEKGCGEAKRVESTICLKTDAIEGNARGLQWARVKMRDKEGRGTGSHKREKKGRKKKGSQGLDD